MNGTFFIHLIETRKMKNFSTRVILWTRKFIAYLVSFVNDNQAVLRSSLISVHGRIIYYF